MKEWPMICGSWIKEKDEKVIEFIKKCDHFPSIDEIVENTGVKAPQVKRTLKLLGQQIQLKKMRQKFLEQEEG